MSRTILAKGIDVSTHQGNINWKKVKASGISFAFIRVGYRGYKYGNIVEDSYFKRNIEGALAAGVKVGVYFFSTALNEKEAIEDANYVLGKIAGYDVALPLVFDFEGYTDQKYRTYGITKEMRTACCKAFGDTVKAKGYSTLLYGSRGNIRTTYDLNTLTDPLWIAKYAGGYTKIICDDANFPDLGTYNPRIALWQYTSIGKVSGISGNVDLDYMYIDIINGVYEPIKETNPYKQSTSVLKYNKLLQYVAREAVKWLQWELVQAGYVITIDGKFGKNTLNALKSYQEANGLEVDGKCGPATRASLLSK